MYLERLNAQVNVEFMTAYYLQYGMSRLGIRIHGEYS